MQSPHGGPPPASASSSAPSSGSESSVGERAATPSEGNAAEAAGGLDRIWTVPNALSMLRLALLPVFLWLVLGPQRDGWAVVVLVVMGLSDYLDGWIARRFNQYSRLGEILDPVADRLTMLVAVVGLGAREIMPLWLAIALPARDLFLWTLVPFLRSRGYNALPVHFLGKAATAALLYTFPLLLLGAAEGTGPDVARAIGWAFAVWGTGMYWWAGLLYAWQVRTLLREVPRPAKADRAS